MPVYNCYFARECYSPRRRARNLTIRRLNQGPFTSTIKGWLTFSKVLMVGV